MTNVSLLEKVIVISEIKNLWEDNSESSSAV